MIERFFFNRINIECCGVSIDKVLQAAIAMPVDTAYAFLPLFKPAVVLTKQTDDSLFLFLGSIILQLLYKPPF